MKKIKFVGITAVALLAVAPITAGLTTETAQAGLISDIFSNPTVSAEANANVVSAVNGLKNQTYDESNPMPITAEFQGVAGLTESGLGLSPVQFSSEIVSINSGMDDAATSAMANSGAQKLKIYVSGTNVKADMQKAYNKGNGNKFSFTVTVKNGDNVLTTKKLTYTNNTKVSDDSTTTPTTPTTPTSGLTDVTDLKGYNEITLDGPSSHIYSLISLAGKKSNRGLAGATDWYTDKSAKDASGNTYYRVSTDEWVQLATGATLSTR
ncbi:hypothetical protein [Companilactobacillus sp.]|uniref:hypothetical protein n=1 Tax=Companilactobacillus sp. TaxID=2767905 RepID=UPI0025BDFD2A|nr:hypothetical protein [Companilactobacillus sp.]MCH4009298.1 hypothetical protein [Companilactobacillus sp.]MCH4050523.1 hypothetical protein [Companilactobacillus sp.]MCH4077240.1 hypothetical protein [Companilactobacillus sp.]MCH4125816.1 hypothetical protein [Companilactobacillus sp.]MCI1311525.1 hypothetical protein [Companilactobacillus sp.]